jgi:hypothetical protein
MKDGKLNANFFIGGSRDRMAELQEDFYEKVGKQFDLNRGRPREETKARHTPHTLAATAAKNDEREKKLNEASGDFKKVMGTTPADIRELKNKVAQWDNQTPDNLRQFAKLVEAKGFKTVGEYRKALEAQREQQQQKHSFSR